MNPSRNADTSLTRSPAPVWAILAVTLYHVVALTAGFGVLIAVFGFPDILREPAQDRLRLFMEGYNTIVPTYYALSLTGLTQAALAVLILLCAPRRDEGFLVLSGLFGVLCGAFQILGFIRWPIVIPYLAEAMAAAPTPEAQQTVVLLEGLMNRYAGMAIGEHLGFLGMGFWTLFLGLAVLKQPFMDRRLGGAGVILGIATLIMGMEPLGGVFSAWGAITGAVFPFWTTWLVLMAVSLTRGRDTAQRAALPRWVWGVGGAYSVLTLLPAYMG